MDDKKQEGLRELTEEEVELISGGVGFNSDGVLCKIVENDKNIICCMYAVNPNLF